MNINEFLPDPRKVMQNGVDTLSDILNTNMQYEFGRIHALEAMEQIDSHIKKNILNYKAMYKPFYDALIEGE